MGDRRFRGWKKIPLFRQNHEVGDTTHILGHTTMDLSDPSVVRMAVTITNPDTVKFLNDLATPHYVELDINGRIKQKDSYS